MNGMGSPAFHETVDITGLFNKSYSCHVNSLPKSLAISRTKMQRNSGREGMNIVIYKYHNVVVCQVIF